jgi:hypothetical protein
MDSSSVGRGIETGKATIRAVVEAEQSVLLDFVARDRRAQDAVECILAAGERPRTTARVYWIPAGRRLLLHAHVFLYRRMQFVHAFAAFRFN